MPEPTSGVFSDWEAESGLDPALDLLNHYDRTFGTWDLPQAGEFWDAVHLAWRLGREGRGLTVAIIDDGFDLSLPGLRGQFAPWGGSSGGTVVHGSAVALLALAVAPRCQLILYPVASASGLDSALIESALADVVARDCDVLNLSFARPTTAGGSFGVMNDLVEATSSPKYQQTNDVVALEWESRMDGWRQSFALPDASPFIKAVEKAISAGCVVVAAAGNNSEYAYEPAIIPGVFAAGFHGGPMVGEHFYDEWAYASPTFDQTKLFDFIVPQPREALGSSFAAPLISGFAAIMDDPHDLSRFAKVAWRSNLATQGMQLFCERRPQRWDLMFPIWVDAIERISRRALAQVPHDHALLGLDQGCPECSLFALGCMVNHGVFELNLGSLDEAERWLKEAEVVLPDNPHVLLLLGRLYALGADLAHRQAVRHQNRAARQLLKEADRYLQKGLRIQSAKREKRLLHHVHRGLKSLSGWKLPPDYYGYGWDREPPAP